jgi:uncharacterized membrane protein YjgN (DUF898 family)
MTDSIESAPAAITTPNAPIGFRFTGDGASYFGIWIVNLVLTILTLGVYSAWAKVRRTQYFYRHTELAGSSFDFHGSAVKILIGRIIALVMVILYNYTIRVRSSWLFLVLAALALVLPWLLRNSLRFKLYNTSWRNTRFHFRGSVAGAYRVFLLNGILTLITLYLLAPFFHQRLKAYQHGNSWLGRTPCSFHAPVKRFYLIYGVLLASILAFFLLVAMAGVGTAIASLGSRPRNQPVNPRQIIGIVVMVYGALIVFALFVGPLFRALITNLIWSNTRVGDHRIECTLSAWKLMWIGATNFLLVVVTLGFFMPWASVRTVRYQLECMRVLPASSLLEFEAAGTEDVAAVGEEVASAFDFDIAL